MPPPTEGYSSTANLVKTLTTGSGAVTTCTYEPHRNLKTGITNAFDTTQISTYGYVYDKIGRRTSVANTGLAFSEPGFNLYQYNDRNEVTGSNRYAGEDITNVSLPVEPETRLYAYDPIGNRQTAAEGAASKTYTGNNLNQYDTITTGGSTVSLTYDDDGNMITYDGVSYQYNGENRLIAVQPLAPAENDTKVTFIYDFLGRRVQKTTYAYRAGTWVKQSTKKFVYDGWHLIAELDEAGEVTRYFVWGLDLSQTLQGAGGVGGLICAIDSSSGSSQTYQYCYDGNGNVGQVVNSTDGAIVASYAYDPFDKTIKSDGVYAAENTFKFSTKYFDKETGLIHYTFRNYDSKTGRWTSRDPLGEHGGLNMYGFVLNDPVNWVDPYGLVKYYKRWGGPNWTAGRRGSWDTFSDSFRDLIKRQINDGWDPGSVYRPLDDQDKCYMYHDICYGECRMRCEDDVCCLREGLNNCDKNLKDCLINIGMSGNLLDEARRIAAIPVFELQPANRNAILENKKDGGYRWFTWYF
ncbi:MAG: hypothetical protein CSB22_00370 [Deltaproteobacteria bacterium]|nr:MAG: hypothetical protein CSB22_00370 [Deltaproteobacteria bacterium]